MKTKRKTKQISGAAAVLLGQLKHGQQVATRVSALGCARTIRALVDDGLAVLRESKNHVVLAITPAGIVRFDMHVEDVRRRTRRGVLA